MFRTSVYTLEMSLTLGEKLRQAREARGLSLSEVAEQTRISSQYLESIENDEYGILPGGIFNKGFVKSFAKFVGLNEQEALEEYSRLISASDSIAAEEPKPYRPEVLTDDRAGGSMMPTLIVAGIILALMTIGILYGLSYLRQPSASDVAANTNRTNSNLSNTPLAEPSPDPASTVPDMASLKVEFKAVSAAVSLAVTSDGKKTTTLVNAGSAETFEPRDSLKLSYSRSLASAAQLVINGKEIKLPAVPLDPKRPVIEFEINKDNLAQIWNDGAISATSPAAVPGTNSNSTGQGSTTTSPPPVTPRTTPSPRPSTPVPAANANRPATRPATTPRPAATP